MIGYGLTWIQYSRYGLWRYLTVRRRGKMAPIPAQETVMYNGLRVVSPHATGRPFPLSLES